MEKQNIKKRQKATNTKAAVTKPKPLVPSTYALMIGRRILQDFDMDLSHKRLAAQISHPNTYLHKLMFIPAKILDIGVSFTECREYQIFRNQKFINYIFRGEDGKGEDQPGHEVRQRIMGLQDDAVKLDEEVSQWEKSYSKLAHELYDGLEAKNKAFQEAVTLVASELTSLLEDKQVELTEEFQTLLKTELKLLAADIILSEDVINTYRLTSKQGVVEKVLLFLATVKKMVHLTPDSYQSIRQQVLSFDAKLLGHIDEMGGFNQESQASLDEVMNNLKTFVNQVSNGTRVVTRTLHEYYAQYSEMDKSMVSNSDLAISQGVDTEAAELYQAISSR